ncbi:para-nitrobenzyl esterase [Stemphylium lycopersici]|uniref:Carboxylic ester hydrolase n=1 Tax=Stemphylium lycopersici TaxID=183478 RepID=A0A364N990_STELY|nr:para-nitrobenzyl esterase [Stemphylium lycopersici]RAR03954.1 para-nitrobenzyl esterase [Stemphylium lycopersici]RAR13885.1 para-nitrobenzyl esterase [Stemphylium lycopersici]
MHFSVLAACVGAAAAGVRLADDDVDVQGMARNDIEIFLGIPYAQDTSGANRFKPPVPYEYTPSEVIDATKPGPACPQPLGVLFPPLGVGNITETSENCLNLNIARPKAADREGKGPLPVLVWIHGGSFWWASNTEPTTAPDGMIKQSVENGSPIMHVAMNYRLGFFGFANSNSLKEEGSMNAGLRDQRAAIEWVRDNIAAFGGDPERITIAGQSSGGLAIGMQIMAYGGEKPLPFQQGIAQSQALEPGITGTFAKDAMIAVVDYVGCNSTGIDDPETIECLRGLDTDTLFNASETTYQSDIAHNIGDIWLPQVDDDFLPAPPSQLIAEGRFGNATFISGWMEGDLNVYTDTSIATAQDTYDFIRGYLPAMPEDSLTELLDMYPVEEFGTSVNLTQEFYRSARIFRDILMVCPSLHLGGAVEDKYEGPVYFYNFNQTILDPILVYTEDIYGFGVVHTSEFAYIFDSMQAYNMSDYPLNPTESDYELARRASRSWSTFVATGVPTMSGPGSATLLNWNEAFSRPGGPYRFGPGECNAGLCRAETAREMRVL